MRKHMPEGLFRDQAKAESADVAPAPEEPGSDHAGSGSAPAQVSRGLAPRVVVAGVLGALLIGFAVGRLIMFTAASPVVTQSAPATAAPSASAGSPSASAPVTLVPYDGTVGLLAVRDASGTCADGRSDDKPANLVDNNAGTIWRCPGGGVGETIRFTLDTSDVLVGVRVINGNTVWPDRYLSERRILTIRWTFSDGSFVDQGLSGNDTQPQEVRFPPVTGASWVTLTVAAVTVPGSTEPDHDAVSISALDFLTPA